MKRGKNYALAKECWEKGHHISVHLSHKTNCLQLLLARVSQLTISQYSRGIFRRDNAFDNAFSITFCFHAIDPCCNQCCFLELSLGRLAKILINGLAFWCNGHGQYAGLSRKTGHPWRRFLSQLSLSRSIQGSLRLCRFLGALKFLKNPC